MFIPVKFDSVNSSQGWPPGNYSAIFSKYAAPDSRASVMLIEYSRSVADNPIAYDLIVIDRDGTIRVRDIQFLPDLTWRDSDGMKSEVLTDLLPAELLTYRLVDRGTLDDCVVEASDE